MKNLYFAYGSNMHPETMEARSRGFAKPLGHAVLDDYRLSERLFADIDFSEGDQVHGLLWEIDDRTLASLDICEGVAGGLYERYEVPVTLKDNTCLVAIVYEMTYQAKQARMESIFPLIYAIECAIGAFQHNVPVDHLYQSRLAEDAMKAKEFIRNKKTTRKSINYKRKK